MAEADEMQSEVTRSAAAQQVLAERLDAARAELQTERTVQADSGVTAELRAERDLALDLYCGTLKPSENDKRYGQFVYERWKALNPLR